MSTVLLWPVLLQQKPRVSEAIAQGDWVRALWSEAVLGLSLREWREQENVPLLISVTESKGNNDHLHNETVGPSEERSVLFIWQSSEKTCPDHRYSCGGLTEKRKWPTP